MNSAHYTKSTAIGNSVLTTTVIEIPVKRTIMRAAISTKDGESFSLLIANMGAKFCPVVNEYNLTAAQVESAIEKFKANPRTR